MRARGACPGPPGQRGRGDPSAPPGRSSPPASRVPCPRAPDGRPPGASCPLPPCRLPSAPGPPRARGLSLSGGQRPECPLARVAYLAACFPAPGARTPPLLSGGSAPGVLSISLRAPAPFPPCVSGGSAPGSLSSRLLEGLGSPSHSLALPGHLAAGPSLPCPSRRRESPFPSQPLRERRRRGAHFLAPPGCSGHPAGRSPACPPPPPRRKRFPRPATWWSQPPLLCLLMGGGRYRRTPTSPLPPKAEDSWAPACGWEVAPGLRGRGRAVTVGQ